MKDTFTLPSSCSSVHGSNASSSKSVMILSVPLFCTASIRSIYWPSISAYTAFFATEESILSATFCNVVPFLTSFREPSGRVKVRGSDSVISASDIFVSRHSSVINSNYVALTHKLTQPCCIKSVTRECLNMLRESMEMLLNGKDNLCHLNTSHAKAYNLQYDITYN